MHGFRASVKAKLTIFAPNAKKVRILLRKRLTRGPPFKVWCEAPLEDPLERAGVSEGRNVLLTRRAPAMNADLKDEDEDSTNFDRARDGCLAHRLW